MARRRLLSLTLVAAGLIASLVTIGLVSFSRSASALPPPGTDTFGVNAQISITSRLGSETDIPFTGTITVERAAPHDEVGVQVEALHVTEIHLSGLSATGFITISQSPGTPSTGELRSLQASTEFPAASFFDVNVDAEIPASGYGSPDPFLVHNETVLHLVPMSSGGEVHLNSWPPFDVKYQQTPEPCTRMLRNALDPRSPDPWQPQQICVTHISVQLGVPPTPTPSPTPCAGPCPTPTQGPFTPTRTPRPTNTPSPTPTPFGPEDPTFSVAPGGPSGFHPADLLRLGVGGPLTVSGNDDFANAYQITSLPFSAVQSTTGFTIEDGEPLTIEPGPGDPIPACILVSPHTKGATAWYRFTAPQGGRMNLDTVGSNFDTVLAVYSGTSLSTLTPVSCNDDGSGLTSEISGMIVTAGTTYYVQAGGFHGDDATLHLAVHPPGGAGAGNADITVAITCANLGLIGCGPTAPQDDVDALSFGDDTMPDDNPIAFSVAPGSQGVDGSAVASQAACSPAEPQADEFTSSRDDTNTLVLDGDGQGNECPSTFGLGLIERPNSDNLDALDGHRPEYVDEDSDGLLDRAVFFSLAPGSPSLNPVRFSPADILWTLGIGSPGIYASADQLGLQATDDIDGLCLVDRGQTAHYEPDLDRVLFSLKAGSPTLASIHASAADVLAPGPLIRYRAAELGLRSSDDLDAMKCFETSGPSTVKVAVGETESTNPPSYWFCEPSFADNVCETKINAGDTVAWNWVGTAPHDVTECGPSCPPPLSRTPVFASGVRSGVDGAHFEFTFDTPGTYLYYCAIHGPQQMGRIIVNGPGGGTPTPTGTPTPGGVAGDANKDGTINAIDSALILQRSAGLLSSINPRADANGDGQINSIDASLILQHVAGLLTHWPP